VRGALSGSRASNKCVNGVRSGETLTTYPTRNCECASDVARRLLSSISDYVRAVCVVFEERPNLDVIFGNESAESRQTDRVSSSPSNA
jgi:hypothetical protein